METPPHTLPSAWIAATRFVRDSPILVSAALGFTIGDVLGRSPNVVSPRLLATTAAAGTLSLFTADPIWRRLGIAVVALIFGAAAAGRVYRPSFPSDHVAAAPMHVSLHVEGVLAADGELRGGRLRLWLAAERLDDGQGWYPVHGQLSLSVRHAERSWYEGDRIRVAVSLRRPRNFGNPGEFDAEGYSARRGVYVTAFADDDGEFQRVGHAGGGLAEGLRRWRRSVGALFQHTLPEPEAAVLAALIIGAEGALSPDLRAAFSRAGVSHVLSISGLHVGLVAAAGYATFRWLLARSRWLLLVVHVPKVAAALSIVPVLLYAGIAGNNVATTRSVVMILVFVAAVIVDRQRHLIVSLAAAALIILPSSPGAARDISFQLSFVAVLGLVWGLERFWPWWRQWEEAHLVRLRGWRMRVWRPLAVYGVVSLSALAATAPLTALHFNQVSLVALFANALVVPLLGSVAVTLGLLAALADAIAEPLAWAFVLLAQPALWLGISLVRVCAALPYAAVRVVTPTAFELALLYTVLFVVVRLAGRTRAVSLAVLGVVALGDGAWWYADRYHHADLRVTFLSVGNGDSAVVELPGAAVMVIDGGGAGGETFDIGERVIAPFLWNRKIAHVDYLVLSHPQRDHYGGLAFVAAHFSPREFWWNGTSADSPHFAQLQQALVGQNVRRVILRGGERRRISSTEVVIHSPPEQRAGWSANDQSLVLSVAMGATRILFPGDIEAAGEEAVVAAAGGALPSTVLKVPHHGSHTSSSTRFLDAVAPQLAIVSAGFENRFGFPDASVLRRYAQRRCLVARTDRDGAVTVRVTGRGTVEVETQRDGFGSLVNDANRR